MELCSTDAAVFKEAWKTSVGEISDRCRWNWDRWTGKGIQEP